MQHFHELYVEHKANERGITARFSKVSKLYDNTFRALSFQLFVKKSNFYYQQYWNYFLLRRLTRRNSI